MITYWPRKQSINLNLAVSHIFTQTYHKILISLCNKTDKCIPLDAFNEYTKKHLMLELLAEIEILVIDIIELNLGVQELKQLSSQILLHLINTAAKRLLGFLGSQEADFSVSFHSNYNRVFFHEHADGSHALLTYLIFGSGDIEDGLFPFKNNKTPVYHVKALFENILVQTGNAIVFNLIKNSNSVKRLNQSIHNTSASYYRHHSIRQISNFKNSLISQSLINFYIYYPQNIYCGKYCVYLLSSRGIICKYVYINRSCEYIKLSNYQLGSVVYLEVKDFLGPKLNQFIALIGKLMIYIFAKIISKNFNTGLKYAIKKISAQNTNL